MGENPYKVLCERKITAYRRQKDDRYETDDQKMRMEQVGASHRVGEMTARYRQRAAALGHPHAKKRPSQINDKAGISGTTPKSVLLR